MKAFSHNNRQSEQSLSEQRLIWQSSASESPPPAPVAIPNEASEPEEEESTTDPKRESQERQNSTCTVLSALGVLATRAAEAWLQKRPSNNVARTGQTRVPSAPSPAPDQLIQNPARGNRERQRDASPFEPLLSQYISLVQEMRRYREGSRQRKNNAKKIVALKDQLYAQGYDGNGNGWETLPSDLRARLLSVQIDKAHLGRVRSSSTGYGRASAVDLSPEAMEEWTQRQHEIGEAGGRDLAAPQPRPPSAEPLARRESPLPFGPGGSTTAMIGGGPNAQHFRDQYRAYGPHTPTPGELHARYVGGPVLDTGYPGAPRGPQTIYTDGPWWRSEGAMDIVNRGRGNPVQGNGTPSEYGYPSTPLAGYGRANYGMRPEYQYPTQGGSGYYGHNAYANSPEGLYAAEDRSGKYLDRYQSPAQRESFVDGRAWNGLEKFIETRRRLKEKGSRYSDRLDMMYNDVLSPGFRGSKSKWESVSPAERRYMAAQLNSQAEYFANADKQADIVREINAKSDVDGAIVQNVAVPTYDPNFSITIRLPKRYPDNTLTIPQDTKEVTVLYYPNRVQKFWDNESLAALAASGVTIQERKNPITGKVDLVTLRYPQPGKYGLDLSTGQPGMTGRQITRNFELRGEGGTSIALEPRAANSLLKAREQALLDEAQTSARDVWRRFDSSDFADVYNFNGKSVPYDYRFDTKSGILWRHARQPESTMQWMDPSTGLWRTSTKKKIEKPPNQSPLPSQPPPSSAPSSPEYPSYPQNLV